MEKILLHNGHEPNKNGFRYNDFLFPIDWTGYYLDDLFDIRGGKPISRNDMGNDGIACVHYGDIHTSSDLSLNVSSKYDQMPKVTRSQYAEKDLLFDGDIVFADASEDYAGIGKSVVIDNKEQKHLISGLHTIVATSKNFLIYKGFSKYMFSSWFVRKQMMFFAQGISVFGINKKDLASIVLFLPSLIEQKNISEILSTWDEAIDSLNKMLNFQKTYRTGLMKSLIVKHYTKQKKLGNYIRLNKYLTSRNEMVLDRNIEPVAVGVNGIRLRSEIYDKELSSDYSKNKVIRENNLCFGIGTHNIVYDVLLENKTYCVSPAYKVFGIISIDPFYLKCYLDTFNNYYSKKYMIISARQGKSVDMDGLLNERVYAPNVEEQISFSKTIKVIDDYINKLEHLLELYKLQKKGLMQQLLTGKIRVNVN